MWVREAAERDLKTGLVSKLALQRREWVKEKIGQYKRHKEIFRRYPQRDPREWGSIHKQSQFLSLCSTLHDFPKDAALWRTSLFTPYWGYFPWYLLTFLLGLFKLVAFSSFLVLTLYSLLLLTTFCKNEVCPLEFFASSGAGHTWQLPVSKGKIISLNRMNYKGKYLNCDFIHGMVLVILCSLKCLLSMNKMRSSLEILFKMPITWIKNIWEYNSTVTCI